ncbi:uncharacterized protein PHACADRAFT_205686 [Phanerochaete carnosa HHB-10118-sp]|uniref:Translation initiation factor eIF2B subunit delta n=1 Tax=Phanerochaete carnosa (strain HHB-10118-sp) TaxID=650164 RepID=K5WJA1_PHACS|nr:uncharacterized protein PHACADRAFT_205686 [Phanerochaete carnosa HHB-10118-sp]EKM59470.1 hypothetical protein PHACADRAFT_205686 [Phanerochaete carnosa HHB-10118-sp]
MAPPPSLPVQPPSGPHHDSAKPPPKSQKEMTRAERRELQECQRAAKATAKASGQPSTSASAPKKPNKNADASPRAPPVTPKPKDMGRSTTAHESTLGDQRGLRIFSHFGAQKRVSIIKGEIHPAILRLALQFSEFKITGANARCIATLNAFKIVIQDYVTPPNTTLSRHLMTHLSPQISHLVAARPMSITMGNAIRQLKFDISKSSIDLPEQDVRIHPSVLVSPAKDALCQNIDRYISERITAADGIIEESCCKKIKDGDVILTYSRSSVVEKVLLAAHAEGRQFSVIVADSRPLLEGKRLLSVLSRAGIQCTYLLLPSLGSIITEVSTVIVGAHSIHGNGAVYSRAGTALVAMMAKQHSIPFIVCCETYKFSAGVQLDSFTKNELGPLGDALTPYPLAKPREALLLTNEPHLEILNPLYDLTPPTSITAVVTEVGIIPATSVSSIPLALYRLP